MCRPALRSTRVVMRRHLPLWLTHDAAEPVDDISIPSRAGHADGGCATQPALHSVLHREPTLDVRPRDGYARAARRPLASGVVGVHAALRMCSHTTTLPNWPLTAKSLKEAGIPVVVIPVGDGDRARVLLTGVLPLGPARMTRVGAHARAHAPVAHTHVAQLHPSLRLC